MSAAQRREFRRHLREMWLIYVIVLVFAMSCGVDPRFAL